MDHDPSRILSQAAAGNPAAAAAIGPLIYEQLKHLAHRHMRRERQGHTWQTTDLAHEAFIRLCGQRDLPTEDRLHFFSIAARLVRNLLVDHARARKRLKHGGQWVRVPLEENAAARPEEASAIDILGLDEAFTRLEQVEPRLARVVELRFFAGLTETEIAELLDKSLRTIQKDWRKARALLHKALEPDSGRSSDQGS